MLKEICQIFDACSADISTIKSDAKQWPSKVADKLALTDNEWKKKKGIKDLALSPLSGHGEIKAPNVGGRSRFSRPALRLLKQLILSGKSPRVFHDEERAKLGGNSDPMKGLVASDLKFLRDMGDSWGDIYIPSQKLDALAARHTEGGAINLDHAVKDLLGSINDPIVRHRLGIFAARLTELRDRFAEIGTPDEIVLEFIRQDFMGEKRKAELKDFQRKREAARKEAREKAAEAGSEEKSAALKYELAKAQKFKCLYCEQQFGATTLDEYEIEHIVPRSQGGPDAMINYVLAHHECNMAKAEQTPFQWWHNNTSAKSPTISWDGYNRLVDSCATDLRNKKVQLLLREDAPELVDRYTALAETAWISKLAQTVASLTFGWTNGIDAEGRKRVTVISGGLTARVRRKYRLNSILNPCPPGEDDWLWEEKCEKNRSDDRHHALDAMVISFIPGWTRDAGKEGFFRFPIEIHRNAHGFFEKEISEVMPENLCIEKVTLAETNYGLRDDDEGRHIVQRVPVEKLAYTTKNMKQVFDLVYLAKQIDSIRDVQIQKLLAACLASNPSEAQWKTFCDSLVIQSKDGMPGSRVNRVLMNIGDPAEYKDLSKDGTGTYRKAFKGHKGQIVYAETTTTKKGVEKKTFQVRPVYAFESVAKVRAALEKELGSRFEFKGFFQSGCAIEVTKDVVHDVKPLPAGRYLLNTIRTDSKDVKVTTAAGKTHPEIPRYNLGNMIAAGLRRVE
jgi:CRISPR-associated endonuclease Csn1